MPHPCKMCGSQSLSPSNRQQPKDVSEVNQCNHVSSCRDTLRCCLPCERRSKPCSWAPQIWAGTRFWVGLTRFCGFRVQPKMSVLYCQGKHWRKNPKIGNACFISSIGKHSWSLVVPKYCLTMRFFMHQESINRSSKDIQSETRCSIDYLLWTKDWGATAFSHMSSQRAYAKGGVCEIFGWDLGAVHCQLSLW